MFNYLTTNNNLWDDLFDRGFPKFPENMRTDVSEDETNYHLSISLPGYKKEDMKISLDEGYLTVKVERKEENNEEKHGQLIRREIYRGSQSRSYYVGNVDMNLIKASFEDGILHISVPKQELIPEDTTKYISIQ